MVCVLQSKIVSFCQVEMLTNQVKEHFTSRPGLKRGEENGRLKLEQRQATELLDTISDQRFVIVPREEGWIPTKLAQKAE